MSKAKPMSTRKYIEFLIELENKTENVGYKGRIESLNRVLKQLQIEEKTANGETFIEL